MSTTSNGRSDSPQGEIDEFVMLTPGETDAHALFARLVHETGGGLRKLGGYINAINFSPDRAGLNLSYIRFAAGEAKLSSDLTDDWERFAAIYPDLIARNSRLELRD